MSEEKKNTIELKPRELVIRTLEDGAKVVQLKGGTAFDEGFRQECRDKGVKDAPIDVNED